MAVGTLSLFGSIDNMIGISPRVVQKYPGGFWDRRELVFQVLDDVEKARGFYGRVLGLQEIKRPNAGRLGLWFGCRDNEYYRAWLGTCLCTICLNLI